MLSNRLERMTESEHFKDQPEQLIDGCHIKNRLIKVIILHNETLK